YWPKASRRSSAVVEKGRFPTYRFLLMLLLDGARRPHTNGTGSHSRPQAARKTGRTPTCRPRTDQPVAALPTGWRSLPSGTGQTVASTNWTLSGAVRRENSERSHKERPRDGSGKCSSSFEVGTHPPR